MVIKKNNEKFYNAKDILALNADYNIIYGTRTGGKSYQAKEYVFDKKRLANNEEFILLKRFDVESKRLLAQKYFEDYPVEKKTGGKIIDCYGNEIRLCSTDKKEKKTIGYYMSLSGSAHWKSTSFPNVATIIFEEFFSKSYYLDNEPSLFLHFVSTIARNRKIKVFLIGNTISRFCPYIDAWNLYGIMKQKAGTIETYSQDGVSIAVEFDGTKKENKMFFGNDKKSIIENEWESDAYPRLEKKYEEYEVLYSLLIRNTYMGFRVNLMYDKITDGLLVYVYPSLNDIVPHVISQEYDLDPKVTPKWKENRAERIIQKLIENNKIRFSSDLCGTEFYQMKEDMGL